MHTYTYTHTYIQHIYIKYLYNSSNILDHIKDILLHRDAHVYIIY